MSIGCAGNTTTSCIGMHSALCFHQCVGKVYTARALHCRSRQGLFYGRETSEWRLFRFRLLSLLPFFFSRFTCDSRSRPPQFRSVARRVCLCNFFLYIFSRFSPHFSVRVFSPFPLIFSIPQAV